MEPLEVVLPGPPKQRFTLLPPPAGGLDALCVMDVGRAADVSAVALLAPWLVPLSDSCWDCLDV